MQVATRFERKQNNECTIYIKLLNALNKLFQLGNIG